MNHLHEVEDKREEIEEDPPLSTLGESPPHRAQPETLQSFRRPQGRPGPRGSVSPRVPEGIATLEPADPFASIQNPRKRKVHSEVFSAFTGRPRGNNPNHVSLSEAGLAMAKRVFHKPEAERWPSAEANSFMKKYLTLIPNQKIDLESDIYQEPFLKEFKKILPTSKLMTSRLRCLVL